MVDAETIFVSWLSCCLCVQYVACACNMLVCLFLSLLSFLLSFYLYYIIVLI